MNSCKVLDDQICFHVKEVYNVYEVMAAAPAVPLVCAAALACLTRSLVPVRPSLQMFHTRYSLHKQIYSHRATKSIEYMITDALVEAGLCALPVPLFALCCTRRALPSKYNVRCMLGPPHLQRNR